MSARIAGDASFAVVPKWIHGAGLSDSAFRMYVILCGYADNETGEAFPSRTTLAKLMGKTTKTVDRALAELLEAGVITKKAQFLADGGDQTSNLYTVRRIKKGHQCPTPGDTSVAPPATPVSPELDQRELDQREAPPTVLTDRPIRQPRGRKVPMPKGWRPDPDKLERMAGKYPSLNLEDELESFRLWTTAKGMVYADWDAAFENHCKSELKRNAPKTKTDHKGREIDEHGRYVTAYGRFR